MATKVLAAARARLRAGSGALGAFALVFVEELFAQPDGLEEHRASGCHPINKIPRLRCRDMLTLPAELYRRYETLLRQQGIASESRLDGMKGNPGMWHRPPRIPLRCIRATLLLQPPGAA
ncbi:MAG: hypothetical protein ACREXR_21800 [Gammaproteobacteria bacterium]